MTSNRKDFLEVSSPVFLFALSTSFTQRIPTSSFFPGKRRGVCGKKDISEKFQS